MILLMTKKYSVCLFLSVTGWKHWLLITVLIVVVIVFVSLFFV